METPNNNKRKPETRNLQYLSSLARQRLSERYKSLTNLNSFKFIPEKDAYTCYFKIYCKLAKRKHKRNQQGCLIGRKTTTIFCLDAECKSLPLKSATLLTASTLKILSDDYHKFFTEPYSSSGLT